MFLGFGITGNWGNPSQGSGSVSTACTGWLFLRTPGINTIKKFPNLRKFIRIVLSSWLDMAEVKKASATKGMQGLEEFGLVLMHCVWLPANEGYKIQLCAEKLQYGAWEEMTLEKLCWPVYFNTEKWWFYLLPSPCRTPSELLREGKLLQTLQLCSHCTSALFLFLKPGSKHRTRFIRLEKTFKTTKPNCKPNTAKATLNPVWQLCLAPPDTGAWDAVNLRAKEVIPETRIWPLHPDQIHRHRGKD